MKTLSITQLNFKNKFNLVTPCSEVPFDSSVYLRFICRRQDKDSDTFDEAYFEEEEEEVAYIIMEYPNGRRNAISITDACKVYNNKKNEPVQVLRNLNLTVKEGTIYTLLGSSGCGKTTLLSCIVGMTKLDSGDCQIFGLKPGAPGSEIPGKGVGYMPQEIALYGEFSIKEALKYFGRINGMSASKIQERLQFLSKFLHLPPASQTIRSLSGGQQRRVSLAVALLHEPQILILDEPTVGVDPVLRKNIWKHLKQLAEEKGTTVIITTHYIEEAHQANCIGLMKNGRLLAEDSPPNLLVQHDCSKLEDVFYKLCARDRQPVPKKPGKKKSAGRFFPLSILSRKSDAESASTSADAIAASNSPPKTAAASVANENDTVEVYNERSRQTNGVRSPSIASPTTPTFNRSIETLITSGSTNGSVNGSTTPPRQLSERGSRRTSVIDKENNIQPISIEDSDKTGCNYHHNDKVNIMRALLFKNFLCMWRNLGFVVFIFILPAVQAILFCLAIGGNPTVLPVGVVNLEVQDPLGACPINNGCAVINMSCLFLEEISNETIDLKYYRNEKEALSQVHLGNIWGYFVIPNNFSDAMLQKGVGAAVGPVKRPLYADGFQGMHVDFFMDMTSQQIGFTIQKAISEGFQDFTEKMMSDCGYKDTLDIPPPSFAHAIYGGTGYSFREFMAPGIILSIIFFMSVALTGSAFITEKKEGMLARIMVSGVTTGQIITAHMLTQYIIMVGQTALVLAVMIFVFRIEIIGGPILVIILTFFQGTCGMAYGFLISVLCNDERNAIQLALGSFYPNLLLSGVVWPLESIPWYLRQVAMFLPQTMACEAMRSIFSRGWSLTHQKVWPGFAASIIWSIIFWISALISAKIRKK